MEATIKVFRFLYELRLPFELQIFWNIVFCRWMKIWLWARNVSNTDIHIVKELLVLVRLNEVIENFCTIWRVSLPRRNLDYGSCYTLIPWTLFNSMNLYWNQWFFDAKVFLWLGGNESDDWRCECVNIYLVGIRTHTYTFTDPPHTLVWRYSCDLKVVQLNTVNSTMIASKVS